MCVLLIHAQNVYRIQYNITYKVVMKKPFEMHIYIGNVILFSVMPETVACPVNLAELYCCLPRRSFIGGFRLRRHTPNATTSAL